MSRQLSGQMKSTPVVAIKEKEGNYFVGRLRGGPRVVRMKRGSAEVYEFAILDTNCSVQKKVDEKYVEAEVSQNDLVVIFAPTALAGALKGAHMDEIIRMEYLGKKQNKAGTEFHSFKVEALTEDEYNALT